MPRPSSKILATPPVAKGPTTNGEVNTGGSNIIPGENVPQPDQAGEPSIETGTTPRATPANKPKVLKALAGLSPAETKARKKDLVSALKVAAEPLDAAVKEVNDAERADAAAKKDLDKAIAGLQKAFDKDQKVRTKDLSAKIKARDKAQAAFDKGRTKINEQLAALGT